MRLAMLYHASVPYHYWDFAFEAAIHIINRLPTPVLQNQSPWEILFQMTPSVAHLKIFGCTVYFNLRPYAKNKLQPRSHNCIFLGYPSGYKGYRCYSPQHRRFYIVADAVFDELDLPYAQNTSESSLKAVATLQPLISAKLPGNPPSQQQSCEHDSPSTCDLQPTNSLMQNHHSSSVSEGSLSTPIDDSPSPAATSPVPPIDSPPNISAQPTHHMVTRLRDGTLPRRHIRTDHTYAMTTSVSDLVVPSCFSQAMKDANWRAAMADEYTALIKNQTWILVSPPPNCKPIGCKWVFRVKLRADGSLERYKARLVAKGFHQQEGVDYNETFSPVVKHVTVRTVLSIAFSRGWQLQQLDVKNAFLHGHLTEEIFMEQPLGFADSTHPRYVCKLQRSLYGLKQAPRAWHQRLSAFLIQLGFTPSVADSSLFILHTAQHSIFLLVYVDDIIVTGSPNAPLSALIASLQHEFAIKDLGELHYFLGIEIQRTTRGIILHQAKYAADLLMRAKMTEARPVSTPCTTLNDAPSAHVGTPLSDPSLYRSIVGALQYLTLTRPDISYAVNTACQFMHSPTELHWQFVKRILRFIKGTHHHGILFTPSASFQLHAFSDAGWASAPDTRHSVGGFGIFLGSNLISWSSRKQRTVARSNTEAEFKCLADTTAELIWIEALLRDLHVRLPAAPILWCDNISAIYLTSNPIFHARTKHVEIDYHFVRERVAKGQLHV